MVIFGGYHTGGTLEDTWSLNCETLAWSQVGSGGPGRRSRHSAIYRSAGHSMIVIGGVIEEDFFGGPYYSIDTYWSLDLATFQWMK